MTWGDRIKPEIKNRKKLMRRQKGLSGNNSFYRESLLSIQELQKGEGRVGK